MTSKWPGMTDSPLFTVFHRLPHVPEHGMGVYVRNMWNSIDLGFCAIFALYLILRIMDVSQTSPFYYAESLNVLACGAIILFPRLAFMVMSNNALVRTLPLSSFVPLAMT